MFPIREILLNIDNYLQALLFTYLFFFFCLLTCFLYFFAY
ncbi:unnamed protein product [Arabidopsis halleri]